MAEFMVLSICASNRVLSLLSSIPKNALRSILSLYLVERRWHLRVPGRRCISMRCSDLEPLRHGAFTQEVFEDREGSRNLLSFHSEIVLCDGFYSDKFFLRC
jgi:hypothetical protein